MVRYSPQSHAVKGLGFRVALDVLLLKPPSTLLLDVYTLLWEELYLMSVEKDTVDAGSTSTVSSREGPLRRLRFLGVKG